MTTRAHDTTGNACVCWPQYWRQAEAARIKRIRRRWLLALITPPWWAVAIMGAATVAAIVLALS
jgi:hypothetical protein